MSHLEEAYTPPASASYAQVEAYETGRRMGDVDRHEGFPYDPAASQGGLADWGQAERSAYLAGYEAGWAETVPDDR